MQEIFGWIRNNRTKFQFSDGTIWIFILKVGQKLRRSYGNPDKIVVDSVAPCRRKSILEWFRYFQLPFSATNNRSFTDRYNIMTKSSISLWIYDQQYEVPSFNYDLLIHCATVPMQSCQLFLEYCVKYSIVTSHLHLHLHLLLLSWYILYRYHTNQLARKVRRLYEGLRTIGIKKQARNIPQ